MELVNGPDLSVCVRETGALAAEEVARIGRSIADALSVAHRRAILHRDIKPQNVLIDSDGRARLTDFGSARIAGQTTVTRTGGLVGTFRYAPPELLHGERADARSDVYMLGLTLYFAVIGRLPEGPSAHLPPTPVRFGFRPRDLRPELPLWLDEVIGRATAAEPSDRFPTAAAMADALARRSDARSAAVAPTPELRESCFICGASEPLGLGVCPSCGGTSSTVADTLIFIRPSILAAERAELAQRLQTLLGRRAPASEIVPVARGHQALVRVPRRGAEAVVEQLALRRIPARAVRARRAWAPLPLRLYAFLALVGGIGALAGSVGLVSFTSAGPIAAGLLIVMAQIRLRRPLIEARDRGIGLPDGLEAKVIDAFQELSAGTARSLLADIVRIGSGLYASLSRTGDPADIAEVLQQLIAGSCAAAEELDELDTSLARLEAQRERFPEQTDRWLEMDSRFERIRDRLVQRLLEVLTVLGQARSHSAQALDSASDDLSEAMREINEHFEDHAIAAREVERLVGAGLRERVGVDARCLGDEPSDQ